MATSFTVGLCDDDSAALERLTELVVQYSRTKSPDPWDLRRYSRGEDLVEALVQGQRFDLVLLDIYLGTTDGISVARRLRDFDRSCVLIFTTSSVQHALDGYGVRAIQYLVKPLRPEALDEALDQALATRPRTPGPTIQVQNRQGTYRIGLDDILWAESDARVLHIHTKSQGTVSIYEKLDKFEAGCQDPRFLRCHKSFLVNLDWVHAVTNNVLVLETGQEIRISMSVARVKELFASHLASKL